MAYASQEQLVERCGEDAVVMAADRSSDGSGTITTPAIVTAIANALADADADIDSYVGKRYVVPVSPPPPLLTRIACDIGFYKLSDAAGRTLTEEKRKRFEDAMRQLRDISTGVAVLGLPTKSEPPSTNGKVFFSASKRKFGRGSTGGIL